MLLLSIVSNLFIIYWTPHPVKVIQIVTHKKEVWFTLRCIDILSLHVLVVNLPFVSLINIFSTCLKFMDQKTTNAKAVNEKILLALVSKQRGSVDLTGGGGGRGLGESWGGRLWIQVNLQYSVLHVQIHLLVSEWVHAPTPKDCCPQ